MRGFSFHRTPRLGTCCTKQPIVAGDEETGLDGGFCHLLGHAVPARFEQIADFDLPVILHPEGLAETLLIVLALINNPTHPLRHLHGMPPPAVRGSAIFHDRPSFSPACANIRSKAGTLTRNSRPILMIG